LIYSLVYVSFTIQDTIDIKTINVLSLVTL